MELILTPEDIKYLKFFMKYLKSYGEDDVVLMFYDFNDDFEINQTDTLRSDSNYYLEIPHKLNPIISKIIDYCAERIPDYDVDSDDITNTTLTIEIDIRGEITARYCCNYRTKDEVQGDTVTLDDDERLKDVFDSMESLEILNCVVDVSGYGDSGEISNVADQDGKSFDVDGPIEDYVYDYLGSHYGGWEINEGSDGTFSFNLENKTLHVNFAWNSESKECDTIFEQKI